jgi:hypothetical protein
MQIVTITDLATTSAQRKTLKRTRRAPSGLRTHVSCVAGHLASRSTHSAHRCSIRSMSCPTSPVRSAKRAALQPRQPSSPPGSQCEDPKLPATGRSADDECSAAKARDKVRGRRDGCVSSGIKFSTDPELIAKITDVVGLYLNPPENAIVLSIDEKSQIQALNRTQKTLPMQPEQAGKRTHDYVRDGTTTLFAALEIASGQVTGVCKPRHRHQEFLIFLRHLAGVYPDQQLHLIMNNYAAHKYPKVRAWLAAYPRIHIHFTPDLRIMAESGRGLVRHHRRPSHPPRRVSLRPRPHDQDPNLYQRLERPLPTRRLDKDRRPDPDETQP